MLPAKMGVGREESAGEIMLAMFSPVTSVEQTRLPMSTREAYATWPVTGENIKIHPWGSIPSWSMGEVPLSVTP